MQLRKLVKDVLTEIPATRNSDKKLMYYIWKKQGFIKRTFVPFREVLSLEFFMTKCANPESIARARRYIQAKYVDLQAVEEVQEFRKAKESLKGTHVLTETVEMPTDI